jgi:hypothetical protein
MAIYCSSCGSGVAEGASFCSRCGTKASAVERARPARSSEPNPESLVWALVVTLLGGLGILMGFLVVLKQELGFTNELIMLFALICLGLISLASGSIFWVLVRGRRGVEAVREPARLDAPRQPLLHPPAVSVTEATTRSLEPAVRPLDTPRSL